MGEGVSTIGTARRVRRGFGSLLDRETSSQKAARNGNAKRELDKMERDYNIATRTFNKYMDNYSQGRVYRYRDGKNVYQTNHYRKGDEVDKAMAFIRENYSRLRAEGRKVKWPRRLQNK